MASFTFYLDRLFLSEVAEITLNCNDFQFQVHLLDTINYAT